VLKSPPIDNLQNVIANGKQTKTKMKQLAIKFIMPLTIISIVIVTKWWYVLPIDARQTFYWGFPFAFVGEGWQTSGALQFFFLEGLADILINFSFWFLLTFTLLRLSIIKRIPKLVSGILWSIAFFLIITGGIIIFNSYPTINLKRDYDWKIINSGYKIVWQNTPTLDEE
jgi:hypothetical protein